MKYSDHNYREIITKAVCGKGRKVVREIKKVSPLHKPSSILGCWVINHEYCAERNKSGTVTVKGSYDINVWYSFDHNRKTEVVTEEVRYKETLKVAMRDRDCIVDGHEIVVKTIQQPNCLECTICKKGNDITVDIEFELYVEVIGETKLRVRVAPESNCNNHCDDYSDYNVTDEELKDVDSQFINKQ